MNNKNISFDTFIYRTIQVRLYFDISMNNKPFES